jgi:pyrimidine operon attenuation protein / uracil phosphoribosyltransferase
VAREPGKELKSVRQHALRTTRVLLDADQVSRTLRRIAHEIVEREGEQLADAALVGIYTRGVVLAQRLRRLIAEISGIELPVGALDITFYRDDVGLRGGETPAHSQPIVKASKLDFPLDGRTVIVVDDVLYTGRTVRAAIEALFDYGRPARVRLAVLCDRGHRELPFRADFVGKNLPTSRSERVAVRLIEVDEVEDVLLEGGEA